MVKSPDNLLCPACGSTLSHEQLSAGLCPGCLLELALESPSILAELDGGQGAGIAADRLAGGSRQ